MGRPQKSEKKKIKTDMAVAEPASPESDRGIKRKRAEESSEKKNQVKGLANNIKKTKFEEVMLCLSFLRKFLCPNCPYQTPMMSCFNINFNFL